MANAPLSQLISRNPDVLSCIANLSNDEVFTPPGIANAMLDEVERAWASANDGASIWANPDVTFLDPCTKSGVFLREIASRLIKGLEAEIPDLQGRVEHVLKNQVFGLAITSLTSLLSRRSLYCSKDATGKHSVVRGFETPAGNIWFERTSHTWVRGAEEIETVDDAGKPITKVQGGRCKHCGASQNLYDRSGVSETHAYALLHQEALKVPISKLFGDEVHFDVIIGNPPYQLVDGGGEGSAAVPLYDKFVEQAKALEPRLLTMVIPARWYSGGRGLDVFRKTMLTDGGLRVIHDYPDTGQVFPGVNIRGGVCYFLWAGNETGQLRVVNHASDGSISDVVRPPLIPGVDTFIRYNRAISILNKVRRFNEMTMDTQVMAQNPFGLRSNFADFSRQRTAKSNIRLYRSRRGSNEDREVYVARDQILAHHEWIDRIKVLVSKASPGGDEYPHAVFSSPLISEPGSISTETYLIIGFPSTNTEAENLVTYMRTSFFRFLVALVKNTQNISRSSFALVPIQDLSTQWTDEALAAKYNLDEADLAFMATIVKPSAVDE